MRFKITADVLDPRQIEEIVANPEDGAYVTFLGVVRRHSRGRIVSYLEYDAYPAMAEKMMARIAAEVEERWGIRDVAIWHRTGRLEIGETSMVVVVASPHRREAFAACHYAVDRIKAIVPIWKKEVWEDGESWVEGDLLTSERDRGTAHEATPGRDLHPAVREVLEQLKPYGAEKIILFGSHAYGVPLEDSDIDLIIVKRTAKPFLQRQREARRLIRSRTPVDLFVLTPGEYEDLKKGDGVVAAADRRGRVVVG